MYQSGAAQTLSRSATNQENHVSDLQKADAIFLHDAQDILYLTGDERWMFSTFGSTRFKTNQLDGWLPILFIQNGIDFSAPGAEKEKRKFLEDGIERFREYSPNAGRWDQNIIGLYARIVAPNQLYYEVDVAIDKTETVWYTERRTYCGAFQVIWSNDAPAVRADKEAEND